MSYMSRRPRKILILEQENNKKKDKKIKLSKEEKIILEKNITLLDSVQVHKLYSQDRKWVEERKIYV